MVLFEMNHVLKEAQVPDPEPAPGEILVRVEACAVCRTDLHVIDGDLPNPKLPLIPGHEIIGRVAAVGSNARRFAIGNRVGIPWLGWTCGICEYCKAGLENLCNEPQFTGYTRDGGYAELTTADERGRPINVRRTHRIPLPCQNRQCPPCWDLRLWRRRSPDHSNCGISRSGNLRFYAGWRHRSTGVRPIAGSTMGGRVGRFAACDARRRDYFCAGG